MISFDRGSTNLNAVWNEINSIKSDTYSMWNFVSTLTGVDIDSSILSSISSLSSDLGSVISDTGSLNLDVESLYNICSSLSSSISTLSRGGAYCIALSDAVASSLSYVYNMTVNLDSIPYNNVKFYGSMGTFAGYTIPMSINSFSIGELDLISGIEYSMSANSLKSLVKFSMNASIISENTFKSLQEMNLKAFTFISNQLSSNAFININANFIGTNTFAGCCGSIECIELQKNYLYNHYGIIRAYDSIASNTIRNCHSLEGRIIQNNSFYYNYIPIINCGIFSQNTWDSNDISPNINCYYFGYNNFKLENNNTIYGMSEMYYNNIYGSDSTGSLSSERDLVMYCKSFNLNTIHYINKVVLSCDIISRFFKISNINELYLDQVYTWESTYYGGGGHTRTASGTFENIKLIDVHKINNIVYPCFIRLLGIETMRLNSNWSWCFNTGFELLNIQPTNIYTLDFYDCENYLSNSTFIIPSYYSGYDEGNVWISGKPLTEYSYTLSVSS